MEIRYIKKSEWEKLAAFNAAEYSPQHILTNKIYYDWQFDNYANSQKDFYTTLGMFHDAGELVGTFGCFPLAHARYGKRVRGNCLANLIVKKNLRMLGYGSFLLEKVAVSYDLAIDHTINETAWPMFMKAGWIGENLKRYVYIINPENALYRLPVSKKNFSARKSLKSKHVGKFDSSIDIFWERVCSRYPVTIERTADYLNWRYAMHPLVSYEQLLVRDNAGVKGFAIVRIEDVRGQGMNGIRVARLLDVICDEDAERTILEDVVALCRDKGIDIIDYFTSGNFHRTALEDCGFVDGDIDPYASLPILFNPVSTKRTHLNFAVTGDSCKRLEDWYTTKGGGDQDRPY